jgi:hypothetical protein
MGLVSASMVIEEYGAMNALNLNLKEAQTRLLEISLP